MVNFLSPIYHSTPITCLGEDLFEFIRKSPFSAHLRDTKTNKYILCNEFSKENIGLQSAKDIVGLKPREVIEHRAYSEKNLGYLEAWNKKLQVLLDKTYELSHHILSQKTAAIQRDIELTLSGYIRITQTIRSPVFDSKKNIVAIASVDYDFAHQCELLTLFDLYTQYLPKKIAIQNFLQFLEISHYFLEIPTCKEITTLLLLYQNQSIEFVAEYLQISKRTVQEHKASLSRKLRTFNLVHLLTTLRTRHENNFSRWQ